ncbi:hypothetical protein RD792_006115 [Penstemon davidsonii]|uniref:F-box domain-containing protein n=1 Tax=Penstemon davidsonii TaxID=160366 RepID=A0ABR0DDF7_9LAMI|nr:hypothetical protein RD792_006115 [Penstemon davidsonii]
MDRSTPRTSGISSKLASLIDFKNLPEKSYVKDSRTHPLQQQTESELPPEMLEDIISRLELEDNTRASAVCKSWLVAAISVRISNKLP